MSYGIRIYKADGTLDLDISNRLLRIVGRYSKTIVASNNPTEWTIPITGLTLDGTWWAQADGYFFTRMVAGNVIVLCPASAQNYPVYVVVGRM